MSYNSYFKNELKLMQILSYLSLSLISGHFVLLTNTSFLLKNKYFLA